MSQSAGCCAKIPRKIMHILWRFARAHFKRARHLSIALMLMIASARCAAQPVMHAFVLPRQLVQVDSGITMNEFEALRAAVAADAKLEQDDVGPFDIKQFDDLIVTPVALGKAGRGFVVYLKRKRFRISSPALMFQASTISGTSPPDGSRLKPQPPKWSAPCNPRSPGR